VCSNLYSCKYSAYCLGSLDLLRFIGQKVLIMTLFLYIAVINHVAISVYCGNKLCKSCVLFG
jgi:hypothetical protein